MIINVKSRGGRHLTQKVIGTGRDAL